MNGKTIFNNSKLILFTIKGEQYCLTKDKPNHGRLSPTHGQGYTQYFTVTDEAITFDGCDTFRFSEMENIREVA